MQKANPNNKYLREDSFEDFEELQMIFGQNTATGQNAVGKKYGEKLPPRKKARTDSYLEKACEEVTEISSQIFGMIQKRWEKEAEEKEAEDKANNVWDAINEIPDLDDDLRYEAMTLVHSLGMKSGFVKMSVADRRGWIKQNLRKQS
ncbi:hypothetical protein Bca52824_071629 [Brassica carinata]|uniref:At2g29880-like C-terminal domain-containing protein n=1 Tax=Brassica carinata TaxID=52824 RepID=A0A8X7Q9G2_BRACI|nr:hypothetical protein Bca52824_071629 [Brassica carinata]